MPYDPSKIRPAPQGYVPAENDGEQGPQYTDDNPPSWQDYLKAANSARKMLKKLKV